MKKRWIALGAGTLAVVLLAGSVFASSDGYEAYKDALLKTKDLDSAQLKLSVSIADNGQKIVSAAGDLIIDHDTHDGSGTVSITQNNETHAFEFFKSGEEGIIHEMNTDVYMKGTHSKNQQTHSGQIDQNPEQVKNMERLADILLTGVRNQVDLKSLENGKSVVTLNMQENQIPETLNILASLKAGHSKHDKMNLECSDLPESFSFLKDIHQKLPEITTDVKIKALKIEATLNAEGLIEKQVVACTVSGKDASGTLHEKTVDLLMELSNFNTAQPQTIDLEGKTIIECPEHK